MIGCANCGTLNRKGSKYCSNCGQRLTETSGVACRACQCLNEPGSAFCQHCGAALTVLEETAPVATEPAAPTVVSQAPSLPAWLYEPAADPKHEAAMPTPAQSPSQPVVGEEGAANKYLRGIPGVLPSAESWLAPSRRRREQPEAEQ